MRRWILALGAAFLVGGWGVTRYAEEQQRALVVHGGSGPATSGGTIRVWLADWNGFNVPGLGPTDEPRSLMATGSRVLYARGVVLMALGAGFLGFAAPRRVTGDPSVVS